MYDPLLALQVSFNKKASKEKLETFGLDRYLYGEKRKYCR